jgi:OOP family OmpA-OmpF porin
MKKIILILALLMLTVTSYGQFSKWSVSGEYGNQMIGDKTAIQGDQFNHFGLGLRYNVSEIVGVGLTGGYDNTTLFEEYKDATYGPEYDFEYGRVNLEGYINTFKWLDVYSKRFTVLLHAGPGVSFMNGDDYKQTVLNFRGGATLLFKLTNRLALTGDFSTTSNVNQTMKLDGSGESVNTGINSNVSNTSIGLTFYLGKKSKLPHADWYVKPDVIPVINNLTEIVNNTSPTTIIREEANCDCEIIPSEFVFFKHDEDVPSDTDGQGYKNAIFKIFKYLIDNPNSTLTIRGYASPTSSSDEYNMDLSNRRAKEITKKFVAMGISKDRIKAEYFGKDKKYDTEFVHDVARRVELIVKK